MPYIYYQGLESWFLVLVFVAGPILLGLIIGLVAATVAWGGRSAGIALGALAMLSILAGLGGLLLTAPQLWWIAVLPLLVSVAAMRAWYYHTGPATAQPWRFNLRALFAVVLAIGLILAGVTTYVRQKRIEEAAAARIEALPLGSGNIVVHWNYGRVDSIALLTPLSPQDFEVAADAWEQLSQLRSLQLADHNLSPDITERLGRLTSLRQLMVQNIPVTDDDLVPLANLTSLEYLDLNAKHLTEPGLAHLAGLRRLRTLHLYDADQISPAAMKKFRDSLPNLDN